MRIVIDLQGAQTESRSRGIGRYSRALALAIARNPGNHEIWLVLNGAFQETVLELRREFDGLIPPERICVFNMAMYLAEFSPANASNARMAEKIREYFIQRLCPDAVLVTSLFEGYVDNAVTSIGAFTADPFTAVILYDLIPLLNPTAYLPTDLQQCYYNRKIQSLKKANLILTISDYSRQEAIKVLKLEEKSIVNISAGVSSCFNAKSVSLEKITSLRKRLQITRKIVLCVPGGWDERKNIDNLVKAYALLPAELRANYQLILVLNDDRIKKPKLIKLQKLSGLDADELIITGFVSDEDLIALYSDATLSVFPSTYEGFSLPVLEAMFCGTPVIGSNNTSIPEVLGYLDALFDANSLESIKNKMEQVLLDKCIQAELRAHGLEQAKKFSWDESAAKTLRALENEIKLHSNSVRTAFANNNKKPRLAFVSPLLPQRTGIADYSEQILPELLNYFEIELIIDQPTVMLPASLSTVRRRSLRWFLANGASFDRIIYQMGNSPFHSHMLKLLELYPGVIVLHDFFLSSLFAYEEMVAQKPALWTKALYDSHGYHALQIRFNSDTIDRAKNAYPCNLGVLQNARGVIVHSEYSQQLASQWYGSTVAENWKIIPLPRIPAVSCDQKFARQTLGIRESAFVVCSFGLLAPTKLNHRLLGAWLASRLKVDSNVELLFVGENEGGDYGAELLKIIENSGCTDRIRIIGWTDAKTYGQYLEAADLAVQLRCLSRGETSAAILDCMNYGLATIVNAHGSAANLPKEAVWMLPDEFTDAELIAALEIFYKNNEQRRQLGMRAYEFIHRKHDPAICAEYYAKAIEVLYESAKNDEFALIKAIAIENFPSNKRAVKRVAQSIANIYIPLQRQLLIDVSSIVRNDLKTGVERVVRAELLQLIQNPPQGFRIEPVYLTQQQGSWQFWYARQFTAKLLNIPDVLQDQPIDIYPRDIFYALDFAPFEMIEASRAGIFLRWRALGVQINVLVYDLLPVLHPQFFPPGADITHIAWLKEISEFSDRLIGISASVANEIQEWLNQYQWSRDKPLKIDSALLGADIAASAPSVGLPPSALAILERIQQSTAFLMVGTIEPRKGYLQTLQAFEQLWQWDYPVLLLIVGKEGWKHLPQNQRRTLPEMMNAINHHAELGKRLFWLPEVSDEYLQKIYAASTCLIAASVGEGFGLPLIEAAQYKLPIIARDLPVFREVAGQNAYYFNGLNAIDLADTIKNWLKLFENGMAPTPNLQWQTWSQTTNKILSILLDSGSQSVWTPSLTRKSVIDEHLNLIHAARLVMVSTLLPPGDRILDLGGANSPLYKMGYPHPFQKLTLIDLPVDQRHEYYKDIVADREGAAGQVVIRYTDMTTLVDIQDQSVDFVWSGQSIEHVPQQSGERMCREAFRVLKSGGVFCLDTPNRRLTEIHTRSVGGGFIHPEHYIEYFPEQLKQMLIDAGFLIKAALGICEMQRTLATGQFQYDDFLFGRKITNNVDDGYIQFFHCIKP